MTSLEEFGINPGDDTVHARIIEADQLRPDQFFDRAGELLGAISDAVIAEVIPNLENHDGRWHPNGFMVFPLGVTEAGDSLRLHIWPRGERIGAESGPTIHDHGWHLASKVLAGTYRDRLCLVEPMQVSDETERVQQGLLRIYEAGYVRDGQQALVTDGTCAAVELSEPRVVPAGGMHTIEAGIFHSTIIDTDELVATLVLDSPRVTPSGPYILIDTPSLELFPGPRQTISPDDKLRARGQLIEALGLTSSGRD